MQEVIRFTNPTHPDYDNLNSTLKEMESICIDVNENQRKEGILSPLLHSFFLSSPFLSFL